MPELAQAVHLCARSYYSFGRSWLRPHDLARRAAQQGMPFIGLADRDVLHGAVELHLACRELGIRPLHGLDLAWTDEGVPLTPPPRILLLAENDRGFEQLIELSTLACASDERVVAWDELRSRTEGLRALDGGPDSATGRALAAGDGHAARLMLDRMLGLFGPHRLGLNVRDEGEGEAGALAAVLFELARVSGLPPLATWAFEGPAGQSARAWAPEAERHAAFARHPEALRHTLAWAAACHVELETGPAGRFPRPDPDRPPAADTAELEANALRGLRARLALERAPPAAQRAALDRLRVELNQVERAGYVIVLLALAELTAGARAAGLAFGPGRGTLPGSLLAWALGVTGVNPLKHGLYAERWLSGGAPPELQLDIVPDDRPRWMEWLRTRYGPDRVAHACAFPPHTARAALREAAEEMHIPLDLADRIAAQAPETPSGRHAPLTAARMASLARELGEARARAWGEAAQDREHAPRPAVTHPSGVILSDVPLTGRVPRMPAPDGGWISQWDAPALQRCGYLKIDLCSLHAVAALRLESSTPAPSVGATPAPGGDSAGAVFRAGTLAGLFLFEAPALREMALRARAASTDDLAAVLALHRTGWEAAWARYCAGAPEPLARGLPRALEPLLAATGGLLLYDEQIIAALCRLSGWPADRAEALRRAWGARDGARARRLEEEWKADGRRRRQRAAGMEAAARWLSGAVWGAFTRAHAVGCAELAWRMAAIKARAPADFYAALWPPAPANDGRAARFFQEARAAGLRILPPDLRHSGVGFQVQDGALRWGLASIRHVSEDLARIWVAERARAGPYAGLDDFCARICAPHQHRAVESAIAAGAFDFTGLPRGRMAHALRLWIRAAAELRRERDRGQMTLFDDVLSTTALSHEDRPWSPDERAAAEREALGVLLSESRAGGAAHGIPPSWRVGSRP
jgi:DNA polymerase III subunit alpha